MNETTLSDSARAVLAALVTTTARTRPQFGAATGLSKPTISLAITELTDLGLVSSAGTTRGPLGRAATQYELAPTAGWVLALDLGSTHVHAWAQRLDGELITERLAAPTEHRRAPVGRRVRDTVALLTDISRQAHPHGPLRAAAISLGRAIPDSDAHPDRSLPPELRALLEADALPHGVPVLVDNNVNCAALAELRHGAARGVDDFVYLQLGVGIGAGIVTAGRLHRGATGAAGEIRYAPYPFAERQQPSRLELERRLCSAGLLRHVREHWPADAGARPRDARSLFRHAADGSPVAGRFVDEYAALVGQAAATLAAVVDPRLVVLGGGMGQSPLLLPEATRTLHRLVRAIEVRSSERGPSGSLEGASVLARERALNDLLGDHHPPTATRVPVLHV